VAKRRFSGIERPTVLDFGCGRGQIVSLGVKRGLDIYGVDTFEGWWDNWRNNPLPGAAGRISKIFDHLPFADSRFDIVVSNQVFEHISEPVRVLPEIHRVLKPAGLFLALFPFRETWFEGHLGLYFAHHLQRHPALLRKYLAVANALGVGLNHHDLAGKEWIESHINGLCHACFYHRGRDVRRWWVENFGQEPQSLSADYIGFRLRGNETIKRIPEAARDLLFRAVCHVRVGAVLLVRNEKNSTQGRGNHPAF
jgi:SAM-dependent methyltransferase